MSNSSTERYLHDAQAYVCSRCEAQFFYLQPGKLVCPKCGTENPDALVAQFEEEDFEEVD